MFRSTSTITFAMVLSATFCFNFRTLRMIHWPMDEWEFGDRNKRLIPQGATSELSLRLKAQKWYEGVYLDLMIARCIGHYARKPNWWSEHQRCLATNCSSPFRQAPTSLYLWMTTPVRIVQGKWPPTFKGKPWIIFHGKSWSRIWIRWSMCLTL